MGYPSSFDKPNFVSMEKLRREREIMTSNQELKTITLGKMIKLIKDGDKMTKFYSSFEYDDNVFELDDFVLVKPAAVGQKPLIGIIKTIASDKSYTITVTAQRFYRPEEVKNKEGESYKAQNRRELFYSFDRVDILAESISHTCVVHFIPSHNQFPLRALPPGFIVQKFYDCAEKKLQDFTDVDFDEEKQSEIDLFVERTLERMSDSPNTAAKSPLVKRKQNNLSGVETVTAVDCSTRTVSTYRVILAKNNVLTGNAVRDRWLEKLLQGMENVANSSDNYVNTCWPVAVVSVIAKLERVTYEANANDPKKYNQKIRQFDYNLQKSEHLVKRLLKGELEPITLLTMSPDDLKEGLTPDERAVFEPEITVQMQMTEVRCTICREKRVGIRDVINAGGRGDRYQLECCECGHAWFSTRDAVAYSSLKVSSVGPKF